MLYLFIVCFPTAVWNPINLLKSLVHLLTGNLFVNVRIKCCVVFKIGPVKLWLVCGVKMCCVKNHGTHNVASAALEENLLESLNRST